MEMNIYQQLANRTAPAGNQRSIATNLAMGLAGEAGEVVDYLKKVLFHAHDFDRENLVKELGDLMWYASQLALVYDIELNEVAEKNIEKLKKRYPAGFSTTDSINRVE